MSAPQGPRRVGVPEAVRQAVGHVGLGAPGVGHCLQLASPDRMRRLRPLLREQARLGLQVRLGQDVAPHELVCLRLELNRVGLGPFRDRPVQARRDRDALRTLAGPRGRVAAEIGPEIQVQIPIADFLRIRETLSGRFSTRAR
jgi:hypothetical protein